MEAVAKLNNCPTAPRKMRLVVDMVRGEDVYKALNILKFSKKEASRRVEKLLLSAISEGEFEHRKWPQGHDLQLSARIPRFYVGATLA